MTNLATNLTDAVKKYADRPAVKMDDQVLTYADLDDASSRVAGWLTEQGIEAGDRVGIMMPNLPSFPALYYGALRIGAAVVPMNPLLRDREIQHYLKDSGAKLVFAHESAAAEAQAAADAVSSRSIAVDNGFLDTIATWNARTDCVAREDSDTAVILYTSGTTGVPKGAELTHANIRTNTEVSATQLFSTTPDDVIMGCLPLFHAFGQTCAMNVAVFAGALLTLIPRFEPVQALKVIERDKVTIFEGVPTMYVALLQAGPHVADTSSLRLCASGGAALPGEILTGFAKTFGAKILEGYGLSETSPVASFNREEASKPGSIGLPIDGVEMSIFDEQDNEVATDEIGEIVIRGDNIMRGYWNRADATEKAIKNGWFHSGDMGRKDADGFYFIVDRLKDMIIRGGYNVYPREVEEVLYEHPDVVEAAVIGVPHATHGEEIAAAIALKPGAGATEDDLREYVKERVAAYKYPRHVWFVDALPKGATGKILKREINPPDELV